MWRSIGSVTFLALIMVGCGREGGGGGSSSPPPPATYTVAGTVTGLSGTGLVLNSDFGGDLPISASGAFMFGTRLQTGTTFSVGIQSQPTSSPAQVCDVANGTGTIAAANVTTVTVMCHPPYPPGTVIGTVSGLVGSGLTLAICTAVRGHRVCSNQQQVRANGAFSFSFDPVYPTRISGSYSVIISQQPSSPAQRCAISGAPFTKQTIDPSVTVSCADYLENSYVTNAADNTLSSYSVDATTGAVAVIGTATATGVSPHAIVGYGGYPSGSLKRYVYVGNEGSNDVSAFAVDNTTGDLTAVPGSPFPAGTDPQAMAFDEGDGYLYVANAGSDNVSVYGVGWDDGSLGLASTIPTGKGPTSIVVDLPANRIVFVANHGGSNDISAFLFIGGSGYPVPGSPFPAGGSPLSLALGAGGKFLYSANPDVANPTISGFSVDRNTSVLSPLSGSPFPLPVSHYIASDQTGAYLYVTSGASIVGYAIDGTSGALTALPGFPVAVGANAYSISVDSTNEFLFVTTDGPANITGFSLDASTGALTPISGSPFPAGNQPQFIATF